MAAAIESVTKDEMNVTEASKVFNVPQQTLNNRLKRKFGKVGAGRNTEQTPEEEEVLVKQCLLMASLKLFSFNCTHQSFCLGNC